MGRADVLVTLLPRELPGRSPWRQAASGTRYFPDLGPLNNSAPKMLPTYFAVLHVASPSVMCLFSASDSFSLGMGASDCVFCCLLSCNLF